MGFGGLLPLYKVNKLYIKALRYRVRRTQVYSCECAKQSLFLCYCLWLYDCPYTQR